MSNNKLSPVTLAEAEMRVKGGKVIFRVDPSIAQEAAAMLDKIDPQVATKIRAEGERQIRARDKWKAAFRKHVEKVSGPAIRAETEKMLREHDAWAAAHPRIHFWSDFEKMRNSLREIAATEQKAIASGRLFRELFADMDPPLRRFYLDTQVINPAWLVGFSNDEALRRRYEQEARKEQAARLHVAQRAGADANREGRETRKAEARAIYAAPNPKTGGPWKSKEECITYLTRTNGWSRAAIIGYLPKKAADSGARKAPKRGA